MSANGRLTAAERAPIVGGGELRRDAAAAFNAMCAESRRVFGRNVGYVASYRPLARQWYFWDLYRSGRGNLAAYPGTSNHGWGLALDLTADGRMIVNRIGARYGFSKAWSDAPSEWWHVCYAPGHWRGTPTRRTLRHGMRGRDVHDLQVWLLRGRWLKRGTPIGGYFGPRTRAAVIRFQRHVHLRPDGVVGPKTYAALRRRYAWSVWYPSV